jgi:hypothetical protein
MANVYWESTQTERKLSHTNPLVQQIGKYVVVDVTNMYRIY